MKINKQTVILFAAGMVVGYMAQRQLDKVPVIKELPKL
jgi:hypothetical protein